MRPTTLTATRPQTATTARPRVLVLLAAYNGARWIDEQISSILTQEGVEVQLAIRDDGSTDETLARIGSFLTSTSVSLTRGAAHTGSSARNFFALMAENSADGCSYVAFSDQDDVWISDKLATACRHLVMHGGVGYSSATVATWESGRSVLLRQATRSAPTDFLFGGMGQGCTFVLTADFYRRARALLTGHATLARDIHYHDWALYALARTWGLRWTYDPVPSVKYRQHAGNDTGARLSIAGMRKRLKLIRCGWYRNQLLAIATLCTAADPLNRSLSAWHDLLSAQSSWARRLRMGRVCLAGGRRSIADNLVLVLAALSGWL